MAGEQPGRIEVLPERVESQAPTAPRADTRPGFLRGLSLAEVNQIGKMAALAGMFGKDLEAKSKEEVEVVKARGFMKVLAGVEIGLPIVQALGGIDIIDGRVSMRSALMAQLLKRGHKYRYEVEEWDEEKCVLAWFERVDGEWLRLGPSSFTAAEAKAANLIDNPKKPTWRTYRKSMLMNRAIAQGARAYCADALGGNFYDPEELEPVDDLTDEERDFRAHSEKLNRGLSSEHVPTATDPPVSPREPATLAPQAAPQATTASAEPRAPEPPTQAVPQPGSADAPSEGEPLHRLILGRWELTEDKATPGQVSHLREVAKPFKQGDLKRIVGYTTRDDGDAATTTLNDLRAVRCMELCRFFERARDVDREALSADVLAWEQEAEAVVAVAAASDDEPVQGEVVPEGQERLL